jgi:DNA invertase Pin-like site-specific DNA recombinase
MTTAIGYCRTSSVSNSDGDSTPRQEKAIRDFATQSGIEIVGIFNEVISGTVPVESRPAFSELLDRIEVNGVRTVIVEDVSRFARDMLASEISILALKQRGVTVLTTSGEDLTQTKDPARVMMRQVAQSFAQYEKARLVAKLKGARDRASQKLGKRVEGRKSHIEIDPGMVRQAKRLYRKNPRSGQRRSLRLIAKELVKLGYHKPNGSPFEAQSVKNMVG